MPLTFGITKKDRKIINEELARWRKNSAKEKIDCEPEYILAVWNTIGKKIGWDPFTLALWYLRERKENKQEQKRNQRAEKVCRELRYQLANNIRDENALWDFLYPWFRLAKKIKYKRPNVFAGTNIHNPK